MCLLKTLNDTVGQSYIFLVVLKSFKNGNKSSKGANISAAVGGDSNDGSTASGYFPQSTSTLPPEPEGGDSGLLDGGLIFIFPDGEF